MISLTYGIEASIKNSPVVFIIGLFFINSSTNNATDIMKKIGNASGKKLTGNRHLIFLISTSFKKAIVVIPCSTAR